MRGSAVSQQLQVVLLTFAGAVLALVLGLEIGSTDYKPLILGFLFVFGIWLVFFTGEYFWLITIASASLSGTFPILGGSFTPFQILMGIGVGKFLIEEIVIKRRRIQIGPVFDRLMIAGFMGVLTLHAVHDRFGMKFLGSNIWGGRNYINIYVGLAAFFVFQSIPINMRVWRYLPYFGLAVVSFDMFIALLTTAIPKLIYVIYPFYSAVSRTGIEELMTGMTAVDTTRLGAVGNFGTLVTVLVLASVPWNNLFHPSKFFRLVTFGFGWIAVLLSSFRSTVAAGLAVMLVAAFRDFRFRAVLILPPLLAVLLFGLSFVNSDVFRLPKPIQRSLTFVPGSWDVDVVRDAASSNDWRSELWNLWLRDYFPVHPWLGRGFGFRNEWAAPSLVPGSLDEHKSMVEVGNIHNGFYSALDNFGIVGTAFFVIWNIGILFRISQLRFNVRIPGNFVLWFIALGLGASIICYWWSAESVGPFLTQQFVSVSVLLRLRDKVKEARAALEAKSLREPETSAAIPARVLTPAR